MTSTRADITALCMTQAALCRLVPWGTKDLGRLPSSVIARAQALVKQLVTDGCNEQTAAQRLWRELFRDLRPNDWRTHPTAPGAFPIDFDSRGTKSQV